MNKQKSLSVNMVLNALRSIMSILFPFLTFPYATRILGVENIGKYNFAVSIINYFVLLAGLGIEKYAIREGASLRENTKAYSRFANEVFTINVISTILSYIIFFLVALIIPGLIDYRAILFILSMQICMKVLGVEWIYIAFEDYKYITIRSIAFQLVSIILLFVFVKSENDLLIYTCIFVVSSVGAYICNFFHSRKYHIVKITKNVQWKKHLKPILILFAMSATISIYVTSDITILGIMCGEYTVGIYSVSVKIYNLVKQVLSAILVVSIPRLSLLYSRTDKTDFHMVAQKIYNTLFTFVFPAITGMVLLRIEIIQIVSGEEYISAQSSFLILCFALLFCMLAWYWGQCVLLPMKKEKEIFKATLASAIVNVLLNFLLIPAYKEDAAAFTTVLAQLIAFIWCWKVSKRQVQVKLNLITLMKVGLGCIGIVVCSYITRHICNSIILRCAITITISIIAYYLIELCLRNETIVELTNSLKNRIRSNHPEFPG